MGLPLEAAQSISHQQLYGKMLNINQASAWASQLSGKDVTPSNIAYLVNYGLIDKIADQGRIHVLAVQLAAYYLQANIQQTHPLSFSHYKESQTTKHVHRLHPYKGKFIPQLVEYFLDAHTDSIKQEAVFCSGDLVLDPFSGSGTTLIAANEVGLHAIGVDVSEFNCFMANLKLSRVSHSQLLHHALKIGQTIGRIAPCLFERELAATISAFNNQYFPSPQFRKSIYDKSFDDRAYGDKYIELLLPHFDALMKKHGMLPYAPASNSFLDTWYLPSVRQQIQLAHAEIAGIQDTKLRDMLRLILSRTVRSCRATTHRALATLDKPVTKPYYCRKHGKLCHPLFSIDRWWSRYTEDSIKRLDQFARVRTDTRQVCFAGDSQKIDLSRLLKDKGVLSKKIKGIFSSPPYVGMIDYHEQHAYAYEIFGFPRHDKNEIGSMHNGRSRLARERYVEGIVQVLHNCKPLMVKDYQVFLVANDRYGLYPLIAEKAGMCIFRQYDRPVLNRAEGNKSPYSESIFHLRPQS